MPAAFGASVEGVRALLPHRRIDATSKPSETQVEGFLSTGSGWVATRIGYPVSFEAVPDLDVRDQLEELARGLVELYAGAFTEDAAFPERAEPADTSYGSVLWERFLRGVDELLEALGKATAAPDPTGAGVGAGSIAHAFPPPTFRFIPTPPFSAPNTGSRTV